MFSRTPQARLGEVKRLAPACPSVLPGLRAATLSPSSFTSAEPPTLVDWRPQKDRAQNKMKDLPDSMWHFNALVGLLSCSLLI